MDIPRIDPGIDLSRAAFVHPSACLYGDVRIAEGATFWCNVVVRAEALHVAIGARTNIQDFVMIHIGAGTPTIIGANCSITHHVTLHGCTIGDNCLIGIGATIMDGCVIGENSIVAGGAFVKEGTIIPPNSIVMGAPAKVTKSRDCSIPNRINAFFYEQNGRAYARGEYRAWSTQEFQVAMEAESRRLAASGPERQSDVD